MSVKDGQSEYTGEVQPLFEIRHNDFQITVINPETGSLIFSWTMRVEAAEDLAQKMQLMILHRKFEVA